MIKPKYKGVVYIILSAFCFAFMNAFVRLAGELPPIQKSFFRNFVALIFAFVIMKKNKISFRCENNENRKFIFLRSLLGTIGILCNFYSIDHLILADASMLNKMSPFFTIIFSFWFLKERLNKFEVLSIIIAFIGSLFIIKPSFSGLASIPAIIGLIGGITAGGAYTSVRHLGQKGEKGAFIVFCFSGFSCLVTLPYLIFNFAPMSAGQLLALLLAGLAASGGQFAITSAYYYAPAKEISVYDYSQIIFAAVLGFFMFNQLPDVYSIIGYVIICGVALIMFIYNNNNLLKRKKV